MLTFLMTLAAATAVAVPASEAGKPATAQTMFDAASTAAEAGRCAEAVTGFEALEARPATQRNATVLAVIRLRKGICLVDLDRAADAVVAIESGLAKLRPDDATYRVDVAKGYLGLGRLAYRRYDYPEAKRNFEIAKELLAPAERLEPLVWLVRATMFDEGTAAIDYADEALRLAAASPERNKKTTADLQTLHARALLNHGKTAAAFAELKTALAAQGGLGNRVGISDIVTRSDLALAALLVGNKTAAREYLAYTGAGRSSKEPFATAAAMEAPACGGPDDGQPDDVAVIEFGINDDGVVTYANPIYASRPGLMAVAYARAVANWSWRPKDAQALPALFRAVTRVELRCSTSFERPKVDNLLRADFAAWLTRQALPAFDWKGSFAAKIAPAKAELSRRRLGDADAALLPILVDLGINPVLPRAEAEQLLREAATLAAKHGAPATARLFIDVAQLQISPAKRYDAARYRAELRRLMVQPDYIADPRATAALRLLFAEPMYQSAMPADARALLQLTAADSALTPQDPLRVNALVRLASLQAQANDLDAARSSYLKTGLDAQQCALIDAKPALQRANSGSDKFPREAMEWGFEGWVMLEYGIDANGRTTGQRALIAYPPFVFRDAAIGIAKGMQYAKSYRPEGALGCGGQQQNVGFRIIVR